MPSPWATGYLSYRRRAAAVGDRPVRCRSRQQQPESGAWRVFGWEKEAVGVQDYWRDSLVWTDSVRKLAGVADGGNVEVMTARLPHRLAERKAITRC